VGNFPEQRKFLAANPARNKAIQNLYASARLVFLRTMSTNEPADRVVFYLGRTCVEEFSEILLLAGNGHGIGALKILRGMYERAVTSAYILANPNQAELFLDYDKVNKYKAYMHSNKLGKYGPVLPPEMIRQIETDYEAVKPKFLAGDRVRGSWTPLDTASLAIKAGEAYEVLYLEAFYFPTLQIHTTASSVTDRLTTTESGTLTFDSGPQRKKGEDALVMAHNLLLRVLDSHNVHFNLGLEETLKGNIDDFLKAYGHRKPSD
jgi:hypothetical protein